MVVGLSKTHLVCTRREDAVSTQCDSSVHVRLLLLVFSSVVALMMTMLLLAILESNVQHLRTNFDSCMPRFSNKYHFMEKRFSS